MKNIKFNLFSIAAAVVLTTAGAGCAKIGDFGDTNVNPNGTGTPITAALLTNVEAGLGGIAFGTGTGGTRAGIYSQIISETQYTDASLYAIPQLSSGGFYSGMLMDCQVIINRNSDPATAAAVSASGSNANQIAIAKILKSYIIWSLTDKWGDMPYSEALQGAANKSPKYDTQEDIYKAIFKDCADAIAGFDVGKPMVGDIIYGGDAAKWKKLANSIRMMAAMRLTKRYPLATDYPAAEFRAAAMDPAGYISSVADNFVVPFPGGGAYNNSWYVTYDGRSDYAQSKTVGDVLAGLGDTRQSAYGTSAGFTFPYGLIRADAINFDQTVSNGNYSRVLAPGFRAANSPASVLSASHVLLAAAEARERGWMTTGATAQALYNAGVTAGFAEWGLTVPANYLTSGAANYLTGAGVPGNIGANTYGSIPATQNAATPTALDRIALQYWLASYPNGNEGWANWRRTGVPNLRPTTFASNAGGQIPRRYVYGTDEYSLNPAQLAVAIGRIAGGDTQDGKVWWDQ